MAELVSIEGCIKHTAITEDTIRQLVDAFYVQVRRDRLLGPVFDETIGQHDDDWKPHLERMYRFWSSVMLSTGKYHGNPLQKHIGIPAISPNLFRRWLMLFIQTVKNIHARNIVQAYAGKVIRMSESMQRGLFGADAVLSMQQERENMTSKRLAELNCRHRTASFTVSTVPHALLEAHRTSAWARIRVTQGGLLYTVQDRESYVLTPERTGLIEPEVRHFVTPVDDTVFYLEFFDGDIAHGK